jgi:hypothetical protein
MPRSRCFYISTQVRAVCCWSHCFVTKPGRMLIRSILLVMQVRFIFGGFPVALLDKFIIRDVLPEYLNPQ